MKNSPSFLPFNRPGLLKSRLFAAFSGILLSTLLAGGPARAATLQWQGTGATTATTDFNLNTNWQNGTLPGSSDIARFNNSTGTLNANISSSITVGGIDFGSGTHTVSSSVGQSLTLTSAAASGVGDAFHGFLAGQTVTVSADLVLAPTSGTVMNFDGNSATSNFIFSGNISETSATKINLNTSGIFTFSGNNTFTGGVNAVNGGITVNVNSANALGTGTLQIGSGSVGTGHTVNNTSGSSVTVANAMSILTTNAAPTINFGGGSDLTINGQVTLSNTSNVTDTFAVTNTLTLGGVVKNGLGANGLTKAGTGTLVLSGANTYSGTTTVSTGTLLVNNTTGSGSGTGAVSVTGGATLGGTGTIKPTGANGITVNGILAPGAGIGTLTLDLGSTSGTAAMTSGSSFKFELGTANASIGTIAAGSSDLLVLSGASANDFAFNLNNVDFLSTGQEGYYKLFDTSSDNANTWTGLTFDSISGVVSSGLTYSGLAGGLTGNFLVGTASNGGVTGDIYFHAVPEPATWVLLAFSLTTVMVLRRRRV
ncbi:MAG: autotransporter-associated beta strand repeat-containing protein [Terrimicrobiaceae bacterium]